MRQVIKTEGILGLDTTDYKHTILRVTMKNREKYVLDMTGAQYGWYEAVTPWPVYNASRVRSFTEVLPFGSARDFLKARAVKCGGQWQWIRSIKDQFAEVVDRIVVRWQKDHISLTELLRLPEHDFQKNQASLVDAVEELLQRHKKFLEAQGIFNVSGGSKEGALDRPFTSATRCTVSPESLASLNDGITGGS